MIRIDIEGGDGAGKTKALEHAYAYLVAKGLRVLKTREVGNPHVPVCVALRLVVDPQYNMDPRAMQLVFAAMHIENERYYESLRDDDLLEGYDVVLSDRGWLTQLVYSTAHCGPEFTASLYENIVVACNNEVVPHVLYMDASEAVCKARRDQRGGEVDAIEAKGSEFQEKVRALFTRLLKGWGSRAHIVKAERPLEDVMKEVEAMLDEILAEDQKTKKAKPDEGYS